MADHKIVIWDWTAGHDVYCQTGARDESGCLTSPPCPSVVPLMDLADIPIFAGFYPMGTYDDTHIISHSYSNGSTYNDVRLIGSVRLIVSQAALDPQKQSTYLTACIGAGSILLDAGRLAPNIEFVYPAETDSLAIAKIAGQMGYIWNQNTTWTRYKVRAAMRQTASNWPNWYPGEGFGQVDKIGAAAVTDWGLHGPLDTQVFQYPQANKVTFKWVNFETPEWANTVIVRFNAKPGPSAVPADGTVLYRGTGTTFDFTMTAAETFWVGVFSENAGQTEWSILHEPCCAEVTIQYQRSKGVVRFDNSSQRSHQDGLTWETAYYTLDNFSSLIYGDTLLFKDTGTPYALPQVLSTVSHRYFNWTGGATGEGLNVDPNRRTLLTNAIPIPNWVLYSGTTYKHQMSATLYNGYFSSGAYVPPVGTRNLFKYKDGVITYMTQGTNRDSLTEGQWYWGDSGTSPVEAPIAFYANFGAAGPPPEPVWVAQHNLGGYSPYAFSIMASLDTNLRYPIIENLHFAFAARGIHINYASTDMTMFGLTFRNCEVSNCYDGIYFLLLRHRISNGGGGRPFIRFDKCLAHHNVNVGILQAGGTGIGTGVASPDGTDFYYRYCRSFANGSHGMYIRSYDSVTDGVFKCYIDHNVAYGNGGKGIYIDQNTTVNGDLIFYARNNISMGNTDEELFFTDDAALIIGGLGYNCHGGGAYGGKWEANKGSGNIESDPLFKNASVYDFGLKFNSPCLSKGTALYTLAQRQESGVGPVYGSAPDIGAIETVQLRFDPTLGCEVPRSANIRSTAAYVQS